MRDAVVKLNAGMPSQQKKKDMGEIIATKFKVE